MKTKRKYVRRYKLYDRIIIRKNSHYADNTGTVEGFTEKRGAAYIRLDHGRKLVRIRMDNLKMLAVDKDKVTTGTGITKKEEDSIVVSDFMIGGPWSEMGPFD